MQFSISSIEQLDELNRSEGWIIDYRQLEAGPLRASYAIRETPFGIHTIETFDRRLEVRCEPPPGMSAVFLIENGEVLVNGQTVTTEDCVWLPAGAELVAVTPPGIRVSTIFVSDSVLETTLRAVSPEAHRPTSIHVGHAGRDESKDIQSVHRQIVFGEEERDVEEAADACLTRLLAPGAATRSSRGPRRTRTIERAREHIEHRLHRPFKISELCRHSGTGLRSLQRHFRKELGLTPRQYVTARRLDLARRALLDGSPDTTDVTAIALDVGFRHLGRFAASYRRFYGELPLQTLRRGVRA